MGRRRCADPENYKGPEADVHSPSSRGASHSKPRPPMQSSTRVIEVTRAGVSFGSALAIAISWSVNHSILWAIVHGILSWLYVLYFALTR